MSTHPGMASRSRATPEDEALPISVPSLYPPGDLEHAVGLLRDQVDALQIAAAEKKRPWYRDHSVLISLVALLLSTIFSAQSVYHVLAQGRVEASEKALAAQRSKLETLRQFMLQLANIRADEFADQGSIARTNPVLYNQRSAVRNQQRQILLESADAIVATVRDSVSAQIFNSLAFEHSIDGRYQAAEQYYLAALKNAPDSASSVVSLQGLAALYMVPRSPVANLREGEEYFAHAVRIIARNRDETAHFQLAQSYTQFAWLEVLNGNAREAARLIRLARGEIAALTPQNPGRRQLTAAIDLYFDSAGSPRPGAPR